LSRPIEKFILNFNNGISASTIARAMRVNAEEIARQQGLLKEPSTSPPHPPFAKYENLHMFELAKRKK
jgi:hypothetical protein